MNGVVDALDTVFQYNRTNFRFDKKLQWKRFNQGRNFGMAKAVLDLARDMG